MNLSTCTEQEAIDNLRCCSLAQLSVVIEGFPVIPSDDFRAYTAAFGAYAGRTRCSLGHLFVARGFVRALEVFISQVELLGRGAKLKEAGELPSATHPHMTYAVFFLAKHGNLRLLERYLALASQPAVLDEISHCTSGLPLVGLWLMVAPEGSSLPPSSAKGISLWFSRGTDRDLTEALRRGARGWGKETVKKVLHLEERSPLFSPASVASVLLSGINTSARVELIEGGLIEPGNRDVVTSCSCNHLLGPKDPLVLLATLNPLSQLYVPTGTSLFFFPDPERFNPARPSHEDLGGLFRSMAKKRLPASQFRQLLSSMVPIDAPVREPLQEPITFEGVFIFFVVHRIWPELENLVRLGVVPANTGQDRLAATLSIWINTLRILLSAGASLREIFLAFPRFPLEYDFRLVPGLGSTLHRFSKEEAVLLARCNNTLKFTQ